MPRRPEIAQKCQKRPEFPEFQKCPELRSLSIRIFLGSRFLTRDGRAVRSTRDNTRFPRWSKNDAILPVNLPNGSLASPPFKIFPSTKISIKDEKSALSKIQSRGYIHQCEPKASSPALKLNFVELSIFKGMLLSLLSLFFWLWGTDIRTNVFVVDYTFSKDVSSWTKEKSIYVRYNPQQARKNKEPDCT